MDAQAPPVAPSTGVDSAARPHARRSSAPHGAGSANRHDSLERVQRGSLEEGGAADSEGDGFRWRRGRLAEAED